METEVLHSPHIGKQHPVRLPTTSRLRAHMAGCAAYRCHSRDESLGSGLGASQFERSAIISAERALGWHAGRGCGMRMACVACVSAPKDESCKCPHWLLPSETQEVGITDVTNGGGEVDANEVGGSVWGWGGAEGTGSVRAVGQGAVTSRVSEAELNRPFVIRCRLPHAKCLGGGMVACMALKDG